MSDTTEAAASTTAEPAANPIANPTESAPVIATPRTVVARGTKIQGAIEGSSAVAIEGALEGSVEAPLLEVAAGASVQGRVNVGELNSRGELSGEIRARHARLSGRLADGTSLFAESLDVRLPAEGSDEKGLVLGSCTLQVGGDLAPQAEVRSTVH